jgi:hypothetical protein
MHQTQSVLARLPEALNYSEMQEMLAVHDWARWAPAILEQCPDAIAASFEFKGGQTRMGNSCTQLVAIEVYDAEGEPLPEQPDADWVAYHRAILGAPTARRFLDSYMDMHQPPYMSSTAMKVVRQLVGGL